MFTYEPHYLGATSVCIKTRSSEVDLQSKDYFLFTFSLVHQQLLTTLVPLSYVCAQQGNG